MRLLLLLAAAALLLLSRRYAGLTAFDSLDVCGLRAVDVKISQFFGSPGTAVSPSLGVVKGF